MKTAPLIALLLLAAVVPGQTPENQLAFAEKLDSDGDAAFALLEFRRFAFLYPEHVLAPAALLRVGVLYLTYVGDLHRGQAQLEAVAKRYPKAPEAKKAGSLNEFVKAHSDYRGEPVVAFLRARTAESRDEFEEALHGYATVVDGWPEAKLADDSLLAVARLQLHRLDRPQQARQSLQRFRKRYPKSSLLPEAAFEEAALTEQAEGPRKAIDAYRSVVERHPDTEAAAKAKKRIAALRKEVPALDREFDREDVLEYRTVQEEYEGKNELRTIITLPVQASEQNVRATLEEALIAAVGKRRNRTDRVRVEAYFNYPVTKAGRVTWRPGEDPDYEVERRRGEDLLKDAIFEILK